MITDRTAVPPREPGTAPAPPPGGERRRAIRNVGWSAVQRWFVRVAGVATFVVMGRLLGPDEIGLVSLAAAAVGFLAVLADFGMSTFLVQARSADRRTTSTVFWTTLSLGVAGAATVAATADALAAALGEPGAAAVLRVLGLGLVLTTLTCVPASLLMREMRFKAIAVRGVVASLLSAVVGIGMAVAGYGVWALVGQNLTQNVISLVWFWAAARWRPAPVVSRSVLAEIARFGSPIFGISVVQALRNRSDQFLIGGLAGVEVLGYWTIATRVLGLVHEVTMSVMDHVALPVFTKVREDRARFERAYEAAVALSSAVLAPGLAVLAVVTPLLIPPLFGRQWEPSVLPAQIMCLAYAVGGVGYFNRAALLAYGRAGTAWLLALMTLALHTAAVLVAGPLGLDVLAWAFSAEVLVAVVVSAVVLRRTVGVDLSAHARAVRALAAAALALVPMWAVARAVDVHPLLESVLVGLVGVVAYVVLMLLVNRRLVGEALADVRGLVGRGAPA